MDNHGYMFLRFSRVRPDRHRVNDIEARGVCSAQQDLSIDLTCFSGHFLLLPDAASMEPAGGGCSKPPDTELLSAELTNGSSKYVNSAVIVHF